MGRVANQELRGVTPAAALERMRQLIPRWQPGEPSWSEELIAARDLTEHEAERARLAGR